MSLRIQNDHARFKDIVRGKIKQNLKHYIKKGELIGKQGKDKITIPVPRIDLPQFRFGDKSQGGVGQGEGEPGDPLPGQPQDGQGQPGKAGEDAGQHGLEVDVTLDDLADMLGEELELPRIEPKAQSWSPTASSTRASTPWVRSRCGTSSAPTSRRCAGRSPWATTTRRTR
jgi:uncharacterized sporulation protein YeaH/YhbH (DUF444 family)